MSAEPAQRFRIGRVPPLAQGFTERPDSAGAIADTLGPGSAVALVPTSAPAEGLPNWLGTSGKTQIAVMIAESLWQSHAVDALIWISATDRASLLSGFVEASVAATGIEPTGTAESVAVRLVSWLGQTSQPWLVVLDDMPEIAVLDGLWPVGPTGRLLITGTQPAVDLARPGLLVIPVGLFSVREALNSLTERLSANPVQRQGAIDLIETLGREPLALAQASSVVASSNLTCQDYRDHFLSRRKQLWTGADGMMSPAMVTWTVSLERAEWLLPDQSVRLMLVLVALLYGHGIPGAIFGTQAVAAYLSGATSVAADPKPAWDALLALERVGLICVNRDVTSPTILMSSAVQAAIRLAAPARIQEPAARAAASALLEVWPPHEPEPWVAAGLRANAASLQGSATDVLWADGCHPLLLRAGQSLDEAHLVGPAVEYWRDLAARCDTKLGPGHPDALAVAAKLAAAHMTAGHGQEAVQWYQRVLAERARELAPGHPAVVAMGVSLARALVLAGQPGDAVTVLLRVVSDCEQAHGTGHPDALSARDELASAYQAAGDLAAASQLLRRTAADHDRLQGPRDARTMATRERLAAAYLAEGNIKDAIKQYKQVLSDRQKVQGRRHPDAIATAASLSAVYRQAGRMPAAMQLAEQCCADSERVLGPDHADTLARQANLAHLYYAVGRVGDATALLRETAARCERTLPPADKLTRAVRQSLVNIGPG
jgi:tetratricopeptide (TPR) repeat protein